MSVLAGFGFTNSGCNNGEDILVGGTVGFLDYSTGGVTSWSWNFGDPSSGINNTSSLQNPSHTYTGAIGTSYNVTLIVGGPGDPSSATHTIGVLSVHEFFSVSDGPYYVGVPVSFTDESTGPVATYYYGFGDGATSTEQNPSHIYSAPASYGAAAMVSDVIGTEGHYSSGSRVVL